MSGEAGWFADIDRDQPPGAYHWQPCLETGTGHVPCFEVWFATREECEAWIRETVLPIAGTLLDA